MKFKVNHPCWCGSGEKYKRCHQGRDNLTPLHPKELEKKVRKGHDKPICLHPKATSECGDKVIAAHSVQRAGAISKIVDATNHVRSFYPPQSSEDGTRILHRIGWKEASTFRGFCDKHDADTFKELETRDFVADSQQCFLIGYRAMCHELYRKRMVAQNNAMIRREIDRGRPLEEQVELQRVLGTFGAGNLKGVEDISVMKAVYDSELLSNDCSKVNYAAILFDGDVSIAATSITHAEFDFDGVRLQNLADMSKNMEGVAFGIVSTATGGAFVFSWLAGNHSATNLVTSLLNKPASLIPAYLVDYVFAHVENAFFSDSWWNGLATTQRDRLRELAVMPCAYGKPVYYSKQVVVNWNIRNVVQQIS